jgi:hypothetical protein
MTRGLYDCPQIPGGPDGVLCRVIVATHPAGKKKSPIGVTRAGIVYERFFTNLPPHAFTACDVVELYLHRGAFEPLLADEDQELDPDRWCSHSAWGQEGWHVVAQWVWNLRLELGHQMEPTPLRTTEFAPALSLQREQATARLVSSPPASGYAPPTTATSWKADRFTGSGFPLQPDGTLRCPAGQQLVSQEQRREADGSLRIVDGASIRSGRPCPLREPCQWNGAATAKPRQGSVLLHPLLMGSAPLLWREWSRKAPRRACMQLLRHQRVEVNLSPPTSTPLPITKLVLSRAQRARSRLSWSERLVRKRRTQTAGQVTIRLFGVPVALATSLDLATA